MKGPIKSKILLDAYMQTALTQQKHIGLSFAFYDSGEIHYWNYGHSDIERRTPINETHIFEIASLGKIFTALLFAKLFQEKRCHLSDFVEKYVPEFKFKNSITLEHLLTHRSGLSRDPSNFKSIAPENSFKNYGEAQLKDALKELERAPTTGTFSYSNFGYALLGLIAKRVTAESDFSALSEKIILSHLGLPDTVFRLTPKQECRFHPGFTNDLKPMVYRSYNAYTSAGGLCSTTADLINFASMILRGEQSELKAALDKTLAIFSDNTEAQMGLAWHIRKHDDFISYYHPGGLAGVKSALLVCPKLQRAVAYISNTENHVKPVWDILLS